MESLGTAVLELVADVKPLAATLKEGKVAAEEMASTTASGFKGGIQKAAIPAAAAVGALVIGLHKSVDAAMENQAAEAKLAAAFKATGLNIDDYKGAIDKAESSSASLGFKSEDVKASLAQLVVATHSGSDAIKMLAVAQDVARYKGISLTDASKLLTTTMAGSARAAHALGIVLPPVTDATDALKSKTQYASLAAYEHAKATAYMSDKQATAQKMVDLLNQKLGGQAQAFSQTAQGAKEKMGAEFQLLEINIGNALIPVLTKVSMVLANFSQFLTEHAKIVKIVLLVIGTLGTAILLYTGYVKAAAAAQELWNGLMDANPIGLIIVAIAALVVAFVELWKHSQTFRDIVKGVWHDVEAATRVYVDYVKTVIAFFRTTFSVIEDLIKGPFKRGFEDIKGIPGDITDAFAKVGRWFDNASGWAIKHLITEPFTAAWDAIRGIPGDIVSVFGDIGGGLRRVMGGIGEAITSVFKAPINAIIGVIDAIKLPSGIHIKTWHGIPDGFSVDWSYPFHIPMLASGGIVSSPTLAMIGERGPEAVIPLDGKHGVGGGVTINVSGVVGNERDVALKIGRELQNLKNRGLDFALA